MTDYFDFPALPAVIQDLIVEEIVHNSVPEDRIQFAVACKVFNEMVKRAKPKKIIRLLFTLDGSNMLLTSDNGSKMIDKSSEELIEIFKKCQIKSVSLPIEMKIFEPDQNGSQIFFEACKFATKLTVDGDQNDHFTKFFKTLKHLKHLDFGNNFWFLEHCSYLPPNVRYHIKEYDESCHQFLLKLAERSQQEPLRSAKTFSYIPVDVIQEFLKAAKFQVNGRINFRFEACSKKFEVFMTFLGGDSYRIDVRRAGAPTITVNQQFNGEKKRILTLQWILELPDSIFDFKPPKPLPFIVKSSSKTLANTIEKIVQKKDWFLEAIYWSSAIVVYYCIMKIIGYSFFGYL
uniref:F-box domain-containing protein n=1 Tax=Panagrolaimus sp. JU765 TaxID=591449 RepID=A0AC34Q653_9BILA